jgi:2-phosphoglycerate kinase
VTAVPDLRRVAWLGGASGAGKSTIARRLAAEHGLRLYDTDAVMSDHAGRSTPESCPHLAQFMAMDMDERWLHRSPETMLETFHWYRGEAFEMIVDDLRGLRSGPGVIAEGFRLLPHLVKPLLDGANRAVWLLPTPSFRRAAFDQRDSLWSIAGQTSDPPRALSNLLTRDAMFTARLRGEAADLSVPVIEVDERRTEDLHKHALTSGFTCRPSMRG